MVLSVGKTYIKAIVTGHIIEIYEYEKMPSMPSNKKQKQSDLVMNDFVEYNSYQDRKNNTRRSRNTLRRIIAANFSSGSKFITLTFKDNLKCVKTANYEFMKFIQRLRYRYKGFKYVVVIEFQKRGAVHYHMMSDLPYIDNKKLADIWGHGFVKINDIRHVDNVGAYMIKYMAKDNGDTRLQGLKSYQTSRGLKRPLEFVGDSVDDIIKIYDLKNKKTVFDSIYETEHLGNASYREYNLKR